MERDYLWECAVILLWEHVLGTLVRQSLEGKQQAQHGDGGMLPSEDEQEFAVVRRYSKLA